MSNTINSTSAATLNTGSTKTNSTDNTQLSSSDFLKILSAQLANQDPNAAGDSNDTMQQMTQLSIMSALQTLATNQTDANKDAQIGRAMGLIGHQVSYLDDAGKTQSGTVQSVSVAGGNATLTIDGKPGILPSHISQLTS